MTTTTTEVQEQTEQETQALEQREAEEGLAAGYSKVSGKEPPAKKTLDDEQTTTAAEVPAKVEEKTEAATKAAADPWEGVPSVVRQELESLRAATGRLRNIEGHIGGLKSAVDSLSATAKAAAKKGEDAPTETQVKAAFANEGAWKKFKEEFPDFAAPVEAELSSMRAELAKKNEPAIDVDELESRVKAGVGEQVAAASDAAEERAFVRLKYPDWKQTVNTPEFKTWTLQGGPSAEAFAQMKALERTDPPKAEAVVNGFARAHPQWWADKGAAMFGSTADSAIKLLDGFKAHKEQAATAEQTKQKQQKRLEGAMTPKGTTAPPQTGIPDEEGLARGYKKARGR